MYMRRVFLVMAVLASAGLAQGKAAPKPFAIGGTSRRRYSAESKSALIQSEKSTAMTPTLRGGAESQKAAVVLGLILALNSGLINGLCLHGAITAGGATQAVAAVTASWTNSALGVASGNMKQFVYLSKVILSFLSGSAIAGFLNPKPALFQVSTSAYAMPFAIGGVLLAVASKLVESSDTVKTGFLLCAMANGIQNSVTSTMTGNLCRTSHYSGISSDMGTFIGQCLAGNKANLYKLKVFASLSTCFWLGGYLSFAIGKKFGSSSLLISAALYAVIIGVYEAFAKSL